MNPDEVEKKNNSLNHLAIALPPSLSFFLYLPTEMPKGKIIESDKEQTPSQPSKKKQRYIQVCKAE